MTQDEYEGFFADEPVTFGAHADRDGSEQPKCIAAGCDEPELHAFVKVDGDRIVHLDPRDDLAAVERERDELRAERDGLRNALDQWRWFTSGLGFGDGVTEPQITPGELFDIVEQAFSAECDHLECPIVCELCGETLAGTPCEHCNGSGCGPATALGAYSECEWCAGAGKVHPGCAEASYADLRDRLTKAEATLARVDELAEQWWNEADANEDTHPREARAVRVCVTELRAALEGGDDAAKGCHADRDGDCSWTGCPQLRDGEPVATGRHCPLDKGGDDE